MTGNDEQVIGPDSPDNYESVVLSFSIQKWPFGVDEGDAGKYRNHRKTWMRWCRIF